MRMRPFRTVLKGSYDIDWGDTYEDATIEERDLYPVKTFDMKAYVKEEKHKKTMEAMNKVQEENKAMGAKPTIEPPLTSGLNSGLNAFTKPLPKDDPFDLDKPIDIDAMVKNIDAQIAELEREQREEEARKKGLTPPPTETPSNKDIEDLLKPLPKVEDTSPNYGREETMRQLGKTADMVDPNILKESKPETPVVNTVVNPIINTEPKTVAPKTEKVPVDDSSVVLSNNIVTDDQFFDDFFGDDD